MKMKTSLKNLLLPTDNFILCFLRNIDINIEEYQDEYDIVYTYNHIIKFNILHEINIYPYIYIIHKIYTTNNIQYSHMIKYSLILMRQYFDEFNDFNVNISYSIEDVIEIFFKEIYFLYFIAFLQYYLI